MNAPFWDSVLVGKGCTRGTPPPPATPSPCAPAPTGKAVSLAIAAFDDVANRLKIGGCDDFGLASHDARRLGTSTDMTTSKHDNNVACQKAYRSDSVSSQAYNSSTGWRSIRRSNYMKGENGR